VQLLLTQSRSTWLAMYNPPSSIRQFPSLHLRHWGSGSFAFLGGNSGVVPGKSGVLYLLLHDAILLMHHQDSHEITRYTIAFKIETGGSPIDASLLSVRRFRFVGNLYELEISPHRVEEPEALNHLFKTHLRPIIWLSCCAR
jgi:hypothetical protein